MMLFTLEGKELAYNVSEIDDAKKKRKKDPPSATRTGKSRVKQRGWVSAV